MVASREEAARRAEASRTNSPGTCQLWVRTQYGAPSAGDQDHDGDADAVDGWLSEPAAARHRDRNPPRGVPVAWSGGSHGNGHRAISLGGGKIRSTDAGGSGRVATVDLDWPERTWGLHYLGWSTTIDGLTIPGADPVPPTPKPPRKPRQYVVDVSPRYQPNFDFQRAADEGIDAFIIKCTEGHTIEYGKTYTDMVRRAQATGKPVAVYHFLHDTVPSVQAAYLAQHIGDKTLPVMLDVEKRSMPNLATVLAFITEAKVRGLRVSAMYLPRWYWQEIGKPDLTDPALRGVALLNSAYGRNFAATPRVAYRLNASLGRWSKMGGKGVNLVQFGSRVKIAGAEVDCSIHRGQATQLEHWFRAKTAPVPDPKPTPKPVPEPTPKPPTGPLKLRVATYNLGNAKNINGDLTRLAKGSDVMCFQEAGDRVKEIDLFLKAHPIWRRVSVAGTGTTSVPILFRSDVATRPRARATLVAGPTYLGTKGTPPVKSKTKQIVEVTFTVGDVDVRVLNTHLIPSWTKSKKELGAAEWQRRHDHATHHIAVLDTRIKASPDVAVVCMDGNGEPNRPELAPFVALVETGPDLPTHGIRPIDYVAVKRTPAVTEIVWRALDSYTSDHRPKRATITLD